MTKIEQLVREYEQLSVQIIHWDTLSWTTSGFFSAVEVAFLGGIGLHLLNEFSSPESPPLIAVLFLFLAGLFNLVLCRVWFLVNRCNREWLDVRLNRAAEIEMEPGIEFRIFTTQSKAFSDSRPKRVGTSKLERNIPNMFAVVWVLIFTLFAIHLFLSTPLPVKPTTVLPTSVATPNTVVPTSPTTAPAAKTP